MNQLWEYLRSPSSIRILSETGIQLGLQPAQLLTATGLKMRQVNDANSVISPQQELHVIANLLRSLPNSAGLGLIVGQNHQLTTYGILGYGMMSCATGLEALAFVNEFLPLTFTFVDIQAITASENLQIIFAEKKEIAPELQRFVVERAMAATCRVIGDVLGSDFCLDEFQLKYSSPEFENLDEHLSAPHTMLNTPIKLNASSNRISFHIGRLKVPLPQANPINASMCRQLCLELLEKRRSKLTTTMLITELLKSMSDHEIPKLTELAKMLNMSERTLKRKLHLEGTSFTEILSNVRLEKAKRLLTSDRSLTQIAEELGFSDLSTFSQTYKRWTGVSPSENRRCIHPQNNL